MAIPIVHVSIKRRLFDDRLLSRAIGQTQPEVIAIAAVEGLAHLPWELLADAEGLLVGRGRVPVRWVSAGRSGDDVSLQIYLMNSDILLIKYDTQTL